jgi:hypothetical protein
MPRKKTRYYRNEDGIIGEKNEYQVRRRDTTREDRLTGMKTEEQQIIRDTRNEGGIVTGETTAYRERRRNTNGDEVYKRDDGILGENTLMLGYVLYSLSRNVL